MPRFLELARLEEATQLLEVFTALDIESVDVNGNRFAFPLTISVPIGDIEVNYRGEIDGDDMVGEVENPRGAVPFTGKRKTSTTD